MVFTLNQLFNQQDFNKDQLQQTFQYFIPSKVSDFKALFVSILDAAQPITTANFIKQCYIDVVDEVMFYYTARALRANQSIELSSEVS